MKSFDIKRACSAQSAYVNMLDYPFFAPYDGNCWFCDRNIYEQGGISVQEAASSVVTGCPWCHRAYDE